jgi:hypothetical protein
MRFIATMILIAGLVISGLASGMNDKPAGEDDCVAPTHLHQYADIRIAMVEVTDVSPCGFDFADIEAQTVGPNNSFQFAPDFEMVRIEQRSKGGTMIKLDSARHMVRKGMSGLVTYCSVCKAVFSFRPDNGRNEGVISLD